ncbi:MAG: DUF2461 domain-containing protein [Bacteroidales bacterium]
MKNIIPFLKKLAENNNRDWFHSHKEEYLEVKERIESFIGICLQGMVGFDKELDWLTPKKCMYRIYRDIRFSKDKKPYKDHIGVFISKGGAHGNCSGYYLHFEPGNCFFGAGVYGLPPVAMKKIRQSIYFQSEEFKNILLEPSLIKTFGKLEEVDKMKLSPKGFDKDFKDIDLLKYRYYFLTHLVKEEEMVENTYATKVIESFKILEKFNKFLNNALEF